jgi:uncharacterized protein YhaN
MNRCVPWLALGLMVGCATTEQVDQVRQDIDKILGQMAQLNSRLADATEQAKAEARRTEVLQKKLEEQQVQVEKSRAERDQAVYDLQQAKCELGALQKSYAELERQTVELAKEKDKQQCVIRELVRQGVPVELVAGSPPKNLTGKVMSVSDDFYVVIISIGKDDGVQVGYPFTIHRQDKYVARGVVEKIERDWCVLRLDPALAKEKVLVGDDVTTVSIGKEPREK